MDLALLSSFVKAIKTGSKLNNSMIDLLINDINSCIDFDDVYSEKVDDTLSHLVFTNVSEHK